MNIETMRLLVAKGLSAGDILEIAEAMDVQPSRSSGAERQARYRARLAQGDATRDVTGDVTPLRHEVTPAPSLSLPPDDNNSNPPTHTHPEGNPRAQGPWDFHVSAWRAWLAKRPRAKPESGLPWHGVPEWVPLDGWHEFLRHRQGMRRQVTVEAARRLIRQLETLREDGHPPGEVLGQSVANGWTGLFPLESSRSAPNDRSARPDRQPDRRSGLERACDAIIFGSGPDGAGPAAPPLER